MVRNLFWILVAGLILNACANPPTKQDLQPLSASFIADIGIVNHTEQYIYATAVNGTGGGHAHKMSAGVGNMCCVTLPREWRSGIKVEVGWDMPQETKHIFKSKIVEVEKYDEPGTLYLHFFPDDEVRVVVTNWVGASSHHPIAPPPKR